MAVNLGIALALFSHSLYGIVPVWGGIMYYKHYYIMIKNISGELHGYRC
jgi:hypothetical protein